MTNHARPVNGGGSFKQSGVFIVIDGANGSGKSTQFDLLASRLVKEGYDVEIIKFPQYNEESSYFVREYLAGKYGTAKEVGPYTGSIFFSVDRYSGASKIRKALLAGKVVLADRYVGANMAHQGLMINSDEERNGYFTWLDAIEYKMLGIPRPDINLVLRVDPEISAELIKKRGESKDLHESDPDHLSKSLKVFDAICELFPRDFKQIDCVRNNKLMPIDSIHNLIWEILTPMLPSNNSGNTKQTIKKGKFLQEGEYGLEISATGKKELAKYVTDVESNVYAFNEALTPTTIAAAMARLSRRGDDMRITLLDEFMGDAGKDDALLRRVITAYGDDSVQQLVGQHVVVEGASNLLTKKLEWGRLASYLEQSTRYIYFDQKDKDGKYKYFTPEHLDDDMKSSYNQAMDELFTRYSKLVRDLTDYVRVNSKVPKSEQDVAWKGATRAQACDAVRAVLPVATKSTVGIYASGQALESLIMHLLSDELHEARTTGKKLLDEARKVIPTFLERADRPDRGGAWVAYRAETSKEVQKLATKHLDSTHSTPGEPVQLTSVWPRNELDLVPDMLYEHAQAPLSDIKKQVDNWSFDKRAEVIDAYIGKRLNRRQRPGRALEKAHYSWDILCDYGIFRDLQRHRMVDDLAWQLLTPRYGYEVPQLVEDAGLSDLYESCFDLSLGLYSQLQSTGYELEAQYATLLGHRMRWKLTFNAREAFQLIELRSAPQGHPGYRKIAQSMHEKICEVHPMLGSAMKFVNQDEDPKLTRLAAERYTQFKLNQS